ncbi:MAG: rhomboid family intramembrane serine protease [Promethearchaeota archaeon]
MSNQQFYISGNDIKRSPITLSLLGLNILIFLIVNVILSVIFGDQVLLLFVQDNSAILQGQKLWTLFTSFFIHWDVVHIFRNMLALIVFGLACEKYYLPKQYLLIYFLSGFMGSLFSFLLYPVDSYAAGASGAIYGLMGAIFLKIPRNNYFIYILAGVYIGSTLFLQAPNWAHLFGILTGFFISFIIRVQENRRNQKAWGKISNPNEVRQRKSQHHEKNEYIEITMLKKFQILMNHKNPIEIQKAAKYLGLSEGNLFEKLLIMREKIPFELYGNKIIVDNLVIFNSTIESIIKKYI